MILGLLSGIASAATYSVSNYIDKFLLEKQNINFYIITIYSGIYTFIAGLIILLFAGIYTADSTTIVVIVLSGFFTNISLLPYYKALNHDETSRVVPLFQFIPIFVLFFSFILLHERLNIHQYFGSTLIIIGSFILSMDKPESKILRIRKSFWLMLFSCFLFAISVILYKIGVKEISFWQSLPYESAGAMLCSIAIIIFGNKWKLFHDQTKKLLSKKRAYLYLSINECMYIFSRYFYYFALTLITASLTSITQGFQPFFTLLFGILLTMFFPKIIKEKITGKYIFLKLSCISMIFIGICFIFF